MDLLPVILPKELAVAKEELRGGIGGGTEVSPDSNVSFLLDGVLISPEASASRQLIATVDFNFDSINPCEFFIGWAFDASNVSNVTQVSRKFTTALSNVPLSGSTTFVLIKDVDYVEGVVPGVFLMGADTVTPPVFDSNVAVSVSTTVLTYP